MLGIVYQILNKFTKTERQVFWGTFIIFIVSSTTFGILIFQNKTIKIPAPSNLYREGVIGQPIAINPVIAGANDIDRDLIELLFSGLLDLSKEYSISQDGQTWNVILKPDLRWSDGKPLTSDDVIFTLNAIQNSESRSPLLLTWQGVMADRISEQEIEFTLRTPYAFFLDNLKDFKIVPKHIFGNIPVENFWLSNFNLEPTGNGPYKFVSFEKNNDGFITGYKLETNKYFSKSKPFIKNFEIKFYANSNGLLEAFNSKKIDGFGGLNSKNINDLRLGHQISEKIMPRYYAIFINKNTKTILGDKNILTALNLSTDKQRIIEVVFNGRALIVNEPILPIIDGYDRLTDPGNEFSIEKAKNILDENYWILNKDTGIREKKIGRQIEALEFSIIIPQIQFLTESINIIKEDWQKIGVKLDPIILNPTDVTNEVIKTRNYQMIIFGNILRNNPDIFSFWHSSERFYPGFNLALYENKKVDFLLESVRKNLDTESRKNDLSNLQKLISEDRPAIFLYSPTYLYVGPNNLGGFEEKTITTPSDRFKNINKWYLKTTRVFK